MADSRTSVALAQIFNFLSLSRDIARNQHDSDFSANDGQIIYCFDSTIFNLFFNTVAWRHAVSSFHGSAWASSKGPGAEWQRIEAQSALIASEYLLSEDLPGSGNQNIYLTPWHRAELAARLNDVVDEKLDVEKIEREIRTKLEFLAMSRRLRVEGGDPPFRRDSVLEDDLVSLGQFIHQHSSLVRYEVTRRAATMLVQCEASERLDQIYRLVSRPLNKRIRPLDQLFRPSAKELSAISTDARQWHLRILSELDSHGRSTRGRSHGAVWNDARSIAFIRWAATKTREDQRIVLVTGDDGLFDAYRRWWSDEGITQTGEPEEFILRRTFQYTPIFNLRDSKNDLSRAEGMHEDIGRLFKQINQAIQLTLLPFNLAQMEEDGRRLGSLAHNRHLEHMALRARDYRQGDGGDDIVMEYFIQRLDTSWYEKQSQAIHGIAGLWRDIERIGIGFFYDQVVKRLEDDRYLFGIGGDFDDDSKGTGEALEFLSKALRAITDRTRRTYLPIAATFLRDELDGYDAEPDRAPELLWYQLPNRQTVYESIRAWPTKSQRDRVGAIREISAYEEAPFVLAGSFALAKHDWWKAEEFADYALSACQTYENPPPLRMAEVLFLNAFAMRFRLGSLSVLSGDGLGSRSRLDQASAGRAMDIFEIAKGHLEQYLRLLDGLSASQEVLLYRLRGKSERAALHLFLALHLHFVRESGDDANVPSPDLFVKRAQTEILECLSLDRTVPKELLAKQTSVRNQFLHNGAASEVVRFIVEGGSTFKPNFAFGKVAHVFEEADYRRIEADHALVRAERISFQMLQGFADPMDWPELEDALAEATQADLTIDRLMAKAISIRKNELFDHLGGPGPKP